MASNDAALTAPDGRREPAWQEKIKKAKQARESAQEMRKGKTPVFSMNWSPPSVKA